jgi:hypothetical protein
MYQDPSFYETENTVVDCPKLSRACIAFLRHADNGGFFLITVIIFSQLKDIIRRAIKFMTCLLIVVS